MSETQKEIDLRPCPFCGHDDLLEIQRLEGTILHAAYRIHCGYCGASTAYTDNGHVVAWNRRADLATPIASPWVNGAFEVPDEEKLIGTPTGIDALQPPVLTSAPLSTSERQRAPGPCLPHSKPYCEECNKASQESFEAMCAPPSPSREVGVIERDLQKCSEGPYLVGIPMKITGSFAEREFWGAKSQWEEWNRIATRLAAEVRRLREVETQLRA